MSGTGISWAICKSAPRSRQTTTPAPHRSVFLQTGCPSCRPTNSVKALKALFDRVLACKTTRRRQRYLRRSSEEAAAVSPTSESNGRISCESCLLTTHTSTLEPDPRSPSTPAAIASRTSCVTSSRYSMHHRQWQIEGGQVGYRSQSVDTWPHRAVLAGDDTGFSPSSPSP